MDDDDILLLSAAICRTLLYYRRRKRWRFWIHPVNSNRDLQGAYRHLTMELRSDPLLFRRYFRVSVEQFVELLSQVEERK